MYPVVLPTIYKLRNILSTFSSHKHNVTKQVTPGTPLNLIQKWRSHESFSFRILAVGWDRKVTEFNDIEGREYSEPKLWPIFHNDDITCADVKYGDGIATATYSGELIFWRLETGQPYRRYSVYEPYKFIELKHNRQSVKLQRKRASSTQHINISRYVRASVTEDIRNLESKYRSSDHVFRSKSYDAENIAEDIALRNLRRTQSVIELSVQAVLFLQTRPMSPDHGSVLVALNTGMIQVYSHHQRGGFINEFYSVHKVGDCVLTMATDRKDRYLFTGTAFGYIKIWHVENYCIPEAEKKHICMPLLRLQFIFLRKERFIPRSKRMVRNQKEPMLVSSYRGHLKAITTINFINLPKIVLSSSYDNSCRMWSLGGRYLGTFGSPLPSMPLSPFETVDEDTINRLPPDIKKVASSTTMKVISGIQHDSKRRAHFRSGDAKENEDEADIINIYGKQLREPILGKYFTLPGKGAKEQKIELDTTLSYIPVYNHLKINDADKIDCPLTPPVIERVKKEEYMDFYLPNTTNKKNLRSPSTQNLRKPLPSGRYMAKKMKFENN